MTTARTYDVAVANSSHAATWRNKKMTWQQFCDMQREPRRTSETCDEYQAASKTERDKWKNGPAFVGGYLEGGRRLKGSVQHRSLLALDADFADGALEDDWELLVGAACIAWPTHSSSARQRKLRIVAPLSRDVSPDEYVPLALKVMDTLDLKRFDLTCTQPERLMYSSSCCADAEWNMWETQGDPLDPDMWLASYADWRDVSCWPVALPGADKSAKKAGDPREKAGVIGAFCRAYTMTQAIEEFLPDTYERAKGRDRWTYKGGSSYGGMRTYDDTWAWSDHATDPANDGHLKNSWDLVRVHRFGHLDTDIKKDTARTGSLPSTKAMEAWALELPEVSAELTRAQLASAADDFAAGDNDWLAQLEHEPRTGAVSASARNIRLILANDPDVAGRLMRDVRTDVPVVADCELPWRSVDGLSNWADVDDAGLRVWFEEKWGIQGRQKVADAVELAASARPYDPVKEYLETLPPWDGEPRIDTLLVDMLGAEDTPYTRAVTRKMLCAAVRRAKRPGCAFDYMVILEGRQGMGKSKLLGDLGGEWFTDGVSIGDMARPKDAAEKLMTNWIAEVAELDGMARTSVESLKAFITTRVDNYRMAYARRAGKHPRRSILVGTVNNVNGYLRDASGNRRFWPVRCTGRYELGIIDDELRSQIWAEAAEAEPREKLYLPKDLEPIAEAKQLEAMEEDPREGIVGAYLDRPVPEGLRNMSLEEREVFFETDQEPEESWRARDEVSVAEVWHEALGYATTKATRTDSYAIAGMLRRLGWTPTNTSKRTAAYGVVKTYERGENDMLL